MNTFTSLHFSISFSVITLFPYMYWSNDAHHHNKKEFQNYHKKILGNKNWDFLDFCHSSKGHYFTKNIIFYCFPAALQEHSIEMEFFHNFSFPAQKNFISSRFVWSKTNKFCLSRSIKTDSSKNRLWFEFYLLDWCL